VPHADPALLGAGHLGGRIVPIVDLARLLGCEGGDKEYDGSGEILRLRIGGGSIGGWVDKVERVLETGGDTASSGPGSVQLIDPAALLARGFDAPGLTAVSQAPLGDADRIAEEASVATPVPTFIVVEVAGKPVPLPHQGVEELVGEVAWTPVPRAPDGFLGVGLLRGTALPVLSLAALLGLPGDAVPTGFVRIEVGGRRALVAVDRILGLRFQSADSETVEPLDVAAAIPEELRRIVLGFPPDLERHRAEESAAGNTSAYVAFIVGGLECAIPAECVDRVVGPQRVVRMPRPATAGNGPEGAIELRGQILPVAALRTRLGLESTRGQEPRAYIVLRDADGLGAIGIDQAKQLIRLRPADIVPAPAEEHSVIAGVVARPEGGVLRIIAAHRLWSAV
jgi:purine-binding chemotaxis protein CheW